MPADATSGESPRGLGGTPLSPLSLHETDDATTRSGVRGEPTRLTVTNLIAVS